MEVAELLKEVQEEVSVLSLLVVLVLKNSAFPDLKHKTIRDQHPYLCLLFSSIWACLPQRDRLIVVHQQ